MKTLLLLFVLADTPALADACDDAAQRIAIEVGDAYALRTDSVITISRGRQNFQYTVECTGERPSVVTGVAGYGASVMEFRRLLMRATNLALKVPKSAARSAMDKCTRLAWGHGMDGAETTDDTLAVSCMLMHDAEEFKIRPR